MITGQSTKGNEAMSVQNARMMICGLVMAMILAILTITPAGAAAPDVGLVTNLSGEAVYWNHQENQTPAQAQAFLKIRQGDQFELKEGGSLQLLYFSGGRQETWKGPASVQVGEAESRAPEGKTQSAPEIKILSSKVSNRMKGAPLVVSRSDVRTGGGSTVMREQTHGVGVIRSMAPAKEDSPLPRPKPLTAQAQKEMKQAEKVYQDLRKQAKADDPTPEIYLLSVYAEYGFHKKMIEVIDALLAKKPGDPKLMELKAQARSKL
jgi:hypothetical protein